MMFVLHLSHLKQQAIMCATLESWWQIQVHSSGFGISGEKRVFRREGKRVMNQPIRKPHKTKKTLVAWNQFLFFNILSSFP
jgi:hypothetical protein